MSSLRPHSPRSPRSFSLVLVLVLALTAAPLAPLATAQASPPPRVKVAVEKYELPNGLDVILCKNDRLPTVGVNVWYHVGPANEEPGRTGFAHLFEHMMFKGSRHVADGMHWTHLQTAGASLVNGTTDFDRTNYLQDVPADQLEVALWLESDRMGFLLDGVDQVKLSNQQDVVRNERRQSVENVPYGMVEEEMFHQLFPKEHPYYANVIGSHEDIQAVKLEDVRAFHQRYYVPNNASLAIVGDIDIPKTKALVAKYFGSIPRGADVPPITANTPRITSERRAVVPDDVSLPRVYMAWIVPKAFEPGDAEGMIVSDLLTGNTSPYGDGGERASRLHRRLVFELRIAQDVMSYYNPALLGSMLVIRATAKPGHTAEELEKIIDEEIAKLAAEAPAESEVEASRQAVYLENVRSLERVGWFNGIADRLNRYNYYLKTPDYLEKDLARYATVTPATVKDYVGRYLSKSARVVVHGIPGEKTLGAAVPTPPAPTASASAPPPVDEKEAWRKEPPKPAPATALQLPRPVRWTLPNGLTVYHVKDHSLPLVTAGLVFRSGSAADPADLPGLSFFTTHMLESGTKKTDAMGIAKRLQALGTNWNVGFDMDAGSRWIQALSSKTSEALGILAEVAIQPSFPESEMDRVRQDLLTSLIEERDSAPATATRVFLSSLYGPAHPYGHTTLGTEASIKRITREDVTRFHARENTPANAALVVIGDVKQGDARKLASELFGGWKADPAATAAKRDLKTVEPIASRVVIVDKPGVPQTRLLVGQTSVARNDPDYDRLNIMNTVMGGGFTSRINTNLREKNGYTYGTYSSLAENAGPGRIFAFGGVRTDVTGPAIGEILKEIASMKESPVTEQELGRARGARIQALPGRFETSGSVGGAMASLFTFGLPDDYYQTLPGRLRAFTSADLTDAAKKYLAPERMLIVAVGDRAKIEPQIKALNLGTIALRDANGSTVASEAAATK
ncbi:MAG TPA: pitrilysin family protein [Candidatus Eisenbacteria bacterium]|nr:pitrilysin family protein [Candidatus Eisenbacteria bacterium]